MSSDRFDSLEQQLADNIGAIAAELEKDRAELADYAERSSRLKGQSEVGAKQGLLKATEVLNSLHELSRLLEG